MGVHLRRCRLFAGQVASLRRREGATPSKRRRPNYRLSAARPSLFLLVHLRISVVGIKPTTRQCLPRRKYEIDFGKFLWILKLLTVMVSPDERFVVWIKQIIEAEHFHKMTAGFFFEVHRFSPFLRQQSCPERAINRAHSHVIALPCLAITEQPFQESRERRHTEARGRANSRDAVSKPECTWEYMSIASRRATALLTTNIESKVLRSCRGLSGHALKRGWYHDSVSKFIRQRPSQARRRPGLLCQAAPGAVQHNLASRALHPCPDSGRL